MGVQTPMALRSRTVTARRLRRAATDVEQHPWRALRLKLLPWKFHRQHPIGQYIVDFACPERGLVIELDGGQHATQQQTEERRSIEISEYGYRVIRFWNEVIENLDGVLAIIRQALESPPPHPSPLRPLGRRGSSQGLIGGESRY